MRDEVADGATFERAWIPVGVGHGKFGRLVDTALGHSDIAQREFCVEPASKVVESLCGITGSDRAGDPRLGVRHERGILGQRLGKDEGERVSVGQVKGTAERMTELVMQRHPDRAQADAA